MQNGKPVSEIFMYYTSSSFLEGSDSEPFQLQCKAVGTISFLSALFIKNKQAFVHSFIKAVRWLPSRPVDGAGFPLC